MLTSLQHAKARGAKLVSVNPLPETGNFRFKNPQDFANPLKAVGTLVGTGTQLSDLWLPIKINGDLAFFKGLMKELLAEERKAPGKVIDLEFINQYTSGYEELIESLERAEWNEIVENSGLSRQQIRQAAEIAMNAKSIICCWAIGLTQHKNAVATIREVANFLLLRGNIGKKGAGACPVGGHSNVQGDRTVGIWERPPAAFLDKLGARYQFNPPREHGVAAAWRSTSGKEMCSCRSDTLPKRVKTPVSKSVCVTLAPSPDVVAVGVQIRQQASAAHPLAQAAG